MKLRVSDITFSYNGHPVLKDVSFRLREGEVMCILGVNGAGKSTLLKCLNRVLRPRQGEVLVGGDELLSLAPAEVARRMGYVPQRHPQSRLTVFEAVLMGRRPHIRWVLDKDDYALVEDIVSQMGLQDMGMRPVCDLSGGEVQKVVIARALAQSPQVLLLDEPTSNLDLKNQMEVMGLIRRAVRSRGLSAVVAIHDLNIAARFGDSFLFLKDGEVHSVARKQDLCEETVREVYGVDIALSRVGGHLVVVPV